MNSQEAVNLVNIALKQNSRPLLSKIERQVLSDTWKGITYQGTASKLDYSPHYIRYLACQLWKRLSSLFEAEINKRTIHNILSHCPLLSYAPFCHSNQYVPLPHYYQPYLHEANLSEAIIHNYYQVIGIFGMIGTGKSTFAQGVTQQVSRDFERVIWHSFQADKLPFQDWSDQVMFFLTGEISHRKSMTIEQKINELMQVLKQKRCLLVLDQLEQVFSLRTKAGQYCHKYQGYGNLIQRLATEQHQSYLIFTSRDYPENYCKKLKKEPLFHAVFLKGLKGEQTYHILNQLGLEQNQELIQQLHSAYHGNPWALIKTAFYIKEYYSGNLQDFLNAKTFIVDKIAQGFAQEFSRLSNLEKKIVLSLAEQSRPFPKQDFSSLNPQLSKSQIAEVLESLAARSLLQMDSGFILLSPLFQAYLKTFSAKKTGKIKELAHAL